MVYYSFVKDSDGNFYIIPSRKKEEWYKWVDNFDELDEESWKLPDYSQPVEGSISRYNFVIYES